MAVDPTSQSRTRDDDDVTARDNATRSDADDVTVAAGWGAVNQAPTRGAVLSAELLQPTPRRGVKARRASGGATRRAP
jgi:hypothetical protein